MKATDLMLGDLVIHGFGEAGRITEICQNSVVIKADSFDVGDGMNEVSFAINELRPIPLTDEILKRNGFKYYDNPVSQTQDKLLMTNTINGHYIEIRLDRKEMAIWYDYDENNDCVYSDCLLPSLYWLHDFQHALRLCGINKEIEI